MPCSPYPTGNHKSLGESIAQIQPLISSTIKQSKPLDEPNSVPKISGTSIYISCGPPSSPDLVISSRGSSDFSRNLQVVRRASFLFIMAFLCLAEAIVSFRLQVSISSQRSTDVVFPYIAEFKSIPLKG
ncbi:hypothetical protein DITRI_Ditri10aG0028300 [Diplodiscus trichospermus]